MPIGHHRRRREHHGFRHHDDHHISHHRHHRYRRFRKREYHHHQPRQEEQVEKDPRKYLEETYAVDPEGRLLDPASDWLIRCLPDVLRAVGVSGETALLVSAGPELFGVASISAHFKEVLMTGHGDFGEEEVHLWLNHDSNAFDWTPHFKIVADKEELMPFAITNRVGQSLRLLPACNLWEDKLGIETKLKGSVDFVALLESVVSMSENLAEFQKAIRNVISVLKPGGFLLFNEILLDEETQPSGSTLTIHLNDSELKSELQELGLTLKFWDQVTIQSSSECILVAQKL